MKRRDFLKVIVSSSVVLSSPLAFAAQIGDETAPSILKQNRGALTMQNEVFDPDEADLMVNLRVLNHTETVIYVHIKAELASDGRPKRKASLRKLSPGKEFQENIYYGSDVSFCTINNTDRKQTVVYTFNAGSHSENARLVDIDEDKNNPGMLTLAEQIGTSENDF